MCGPCYRIHWTLRDQPLAIPLPSCTAPGCKGSVACEGLNVCSRHVRHQLGITYRQMDYWARRGFLHPEGFGGSGTGRKWPADEVQAARRMGRLTAAGLPLAWSAQFARNGWPSGELAPGILVSVTA